MIQPATVGHVTVRACEPTTMPKWPALTSATWTSASGAARVMARVRDLHGGRDYDPEFGRRFRGQGVWADLMRQRFQAACTRLGLARHLPPMRTDLFAAPPRPGDQLSLF